MPQGSGASKGGKKKGAPAHQNTFAYKHNPKSKLTDKILNSPIVHVCRRCHEKLEWRKSFRKYKPLNQPSKCNLCQKKNVKAAYHTICTACTTSKDAKEKLLTEMQQTTTTSAISSERGEAVEVGTIVEKKGQRDDSKRISGIHRVCAVCVKEPALRDEDDDNDDSALALETGRMRLRDQRTLERKLASKEREKAKAKQAAKEARREARHGEVSIAPEGNLDENNKSEAESDVDLPEEAENEEDPFLKAVGGSANLLTGEAYQNMLLANAQQSD